MKLKVGNFSSDMREHTLRELYEPSARFLEKPASRAANTPTSNKTANVMQTADHKLRHKTGTAQKSNVGAPKTVIESPYL